MYHHRRKSGHGSTNSSMTDVRKAANGADAPSTKYKPARPALVSRRSTSQTVQKLGKNPRDREKEWEEERWFDEERGSFPQYCMTCDKQFIPQDERFLYCSEECRASDQSNIDVLSMTPGGGGGGYISPQATSYPVYSGHPEPRDIIPRASPSRPSSMHFSPPTTPSATTNYTSAVSALRSLSVRPPSPPSPTGTYHTNIWPFTRSAATSPSTSYTKPAPGNFSSTFDASYYGVYGANTSTGFGATADRPLPSRKPGNYSRPKSIDLVTPMAGR